MGEACGQLTSAHSGHVLGGKTAGLQSQRALQSLTLSYTSTMSFSSTKQTIEIAAIALGRAARSFFASKHVLKPILLRLLELFRRG